MSNISKVHLNRYVHLQKKTRTNDGAGGFYDAWVDCGALWAHIEFKSGQDIDGLVAPLALIKHTIIVRAAVFGAPSRPQPTQRFCEITGGGNRIYSILAVSEHDTRGRYLRCLTTEESAT